MDRGRGLDRGRPFAPRGEGGDIGLGEQALLAVGVTAASATLGPIIPPSLPFVIYGMMANVSVGSLFLAGIVPGVIMTLLTGAGRTHPATPRHRDTATQLRPCPLAGLGSVSAFASSSSSSSSLGHHHHHPT